MPVLVPVAPGSPPGAAEHEAWKGNELLGQQPLHRVLAIGERFRLLGFQAMPFALQAQAGNHGYDADGDLAQAQAAQASQHQ